MAYNLDVSEEASYSSKCVSFDDHFGCKLVIEHSLILIPNLLFNNNFHIFIAANYLLIFGTLTKGSLNFSSRPIPT